VALANIYLKQTRFHFVAQHSLFIYSVRKFNLYRCQPTIQFIISMKFLLDVPKN